MLRYHKWGGNNFFSVSLNFLEQHCHNLKPWESWEKMYFVFSKFWSCHVPACFFLICDFKNTVNERISKVVLEEWRTRHTIYMSFLWSFTLMLFHWPYGLRIYKIFRNLWCLTPVNFKRKRAFTFSQEFQQILMIISSFQQVCVLSCGNYHIFSRKSMNILFHEGLLILTGLYQTYIS